MHYDLRRGLRLAALALASCTAAAALAALPVVPGEASKTTQDDLAAPVLRLGTAQAPRVTLPQLEDAELRSVREANQRTPLKRLAIGVAPSMPQDARPGACRWPPVDAGSPRNS